MYVSKLHFLKKGLLLVGNSEQNLLVWPDLNLYFIILLTFFRSNRDYSTNVFDQVKHIYLFKLNNSNGRKRCKIFSKLTIKTPPGVFIVNFEQTSHFFSSIRTVDFEQINLCWVGPKESIPYKSSQLCHIFF